MLPIAILAVPVDVAQEMTDRLVDVRNQGDFELRADSSQCTGRGSNQLQRSRNALAADDLLSAVQRDPEVILPSIFSRE